MLKLALLYCFTAELQLAKARLRLKCAITQASANITLLGFSPVNLPSQALGYTVNTPSLTKGCAQKMKGFHRGWLLLGLLLAALFSYGFGFWQSAVVFVVLGMLLELAFWVGLLTDKCRQKTP